MNSAEDIRQAVDAVYRSESRRVFATLVRLLRDFDLAEEAMQEAFAMAVMQWADSGVPGNPRAWLISTGRFKAIDALRRRGKFDDVKADILERIDHVQQANAISGNQDIEDDRLRLIFTCCHPAIDPVVQVPLTLREICGLTTEQVASAFLTAPATMAQRIVRGKAKIRDAGIPFLIPNAEDLPERLESVLAVIYLVFNEGYSASSGDSVTRADLSREAIRLGRLLRELLPDSEVTGLLALMVLQESRRGARSTIEGNIVLLEDQDRSLWDQTLIAEGQQLVQQSFATRRFGAYTLQAAIAAVHASADSSSHTDWPQIIALYDALLSMNPSPVVELNRAVALAMQNGPEAGLVVIDAILDRGELVNYHLAHAARGELCRRAGRMKEAKAAFEHAITLVRQEPERRFLQRRLEEM
ncbi:MAG: RNA polymerase sigma factor [Planctomycetaceae bacterium]